jgi:intracellular sulfur oxidation DsrE/DsrF family protein
MSDINLKEPTPRRGFLGMVATGAAALGLTALTSPFQLKAQQKPQAVKMPAPAQRSEADQWFGKVKGTHRVVFDATRPHESMPFVWPLVFLATNEATGSPASDCGVVVVLRHDAIPYALKDELWGKYKFSELFKGTDEIGGTYKGGDPNAGKTRNPFWQPKKSDFNVPGFGEVPIGINDLQAQGVMFCVCNAALTVFSAIAASKSNQKPEDVLAEWKQNVHPGIQIVPSGVWALGRAKEHGCAYIFAG